MIVRPEVFEEDHLPRRLLHRENETQALLGALDPGTTGTERGHAMLSGPSGVGKTALTRYCCGELRESRDVPSAHVSCLGATPGTIVRRTLEDLPDGPDDVRHNVPRATVVELLRDAVPSSAVVVLDEADDVPAVAIGELSAVRGLSLVVICHDPEAWLSTADRAIRERVNAGAHVRLERYGVAELGDILERRAEAGLEPDVVSRGQLERIADDVAGVARNGIQSLRAAAELAAERGHSKVRPPDVADGYDRARREIRRAILESLPLGHRLLHALVRDAGEITVGALHERYDRVAADVFYGTDTVPVGERARRNKLRKLVDYDLLDYAGANRHRVYWPTEPNLTVPDDAVQVSTTRICGRDGSENSTER